MKGLQNQMTWSSTLGLAWRAERSGRSLVATLANPPEPAHAARQSGQARSTAPGLDH